MHVYKKNKNNAQKGSHYHIGGENLLSPKMQNIQSIERELIICMLRRYENSTLLCNFQPVNLITMLKKIVMY